MKTVEAKGVIKEARTTLKRAERIKKQALLELKPKSRLKPSLLSSTKPSWNEWAARSRES